MMQPQQSSRVFNTCVLISSMFLAWKSDMAKQLPHVGGDVIYQSNDIGL